MDPISFITSIATGLTKDLIKSLTKRLKDKFKTPAKEKAIDRSIDAAMVAIGSSLAYLDEEKQAKVSSVLKAFFDDGDTVEALWALLRGKPLDRDFLWEIFEEIAGESGNIPGFDFNHMIDLFEVAFFESAAIEDELHGSIKFGMTREHIKLG